MMKNLSLFRLLLSFFLLAAVLPIILLAFYEHAVFDSLYKQQAMEELGVIADKKANDIEGFIENRLNDLDLVARSPYTTRVLNRLEHALYSEGTISDSYQQTALQTREYFSPFISRDYQDVFLVSLQGEVVFSVKQKINPGTNLKAGLYENTDLATVTQQALLFLTPAISGFSYYQPSMAYAAFIASPIQLDGEIKGVVVFQLDIGKVHEVVLDDTGLGHSGETVAVRNSGQGMLFMAPLKQDPAVAFSPVLARYKISNAIRHAVSGDNGEGIVEDYRSVNVIAAWRYLPSLQWGMVVKQDLDEALRPVRDLQLQLIAIFWMLLFAGIGVALALGQRILKPIVILNQVMSKTVAARKTEPVAETGFREVCELAHSFNKMIASLAVYQQELEQLVDERTHELKRAAQIIENIQEGIVITDLQSTIIDVNSAYCRLFGYTYEELIGKNPRLLSSGRQDKKYYQAMWQQILETGQWSGELWNRKKNGALVPVLMNITTIKDNNGQPTHYVALLTNIEILKSQEHRLQKLAYYDPLTHLPNRMLLMDRLQHDLDTAQRKRESIAIMFMDLDHFKEVNDTLGHDAGDKLLEVIGRRLQDCVRKNDTVSRLGGDEFVVILNSIHSHEDIIRVAENMIASVSSEVLLDGEAVYVGVSIGVSLFPDDAEDVDTLLKYADDAMYHAKENGKGRFSFYSDMS